MLYDSIHDILTDKKISKPDSIDCTPPEFIMPNSKERPLLPLHPNIKELKVRYIIKLKIRLFCVFYVVNLI